MGQGLLVVKHRAEITQERKPARSKQDAAELKALPHAIIATIFRFSLSGGGDDDGDDGGQL
jgi:hypothetical protein